MEGGRARHRYIAGIFLGGLAHTMELYKFWRREEEDMFGLNRVLVFGKEGVYARRNDTPEEGEAFIHRTLSKAERCHHHHSDRFNTGRIARHERRLGSF